MPKAEDEVALEAVTELDGKFEEWHLQAKQDAAQAKADSGARQAKVAQEIASSWLLIPDQKPSTGGSSSWRREWLLIPGQTSKS